MERLRKPRNIDPRIIGVFIDANALDDCIECDNHCVNTICSLKIHLCIQIPALVRKELDHPNTPNEVKIRAADFIYTIPVDLNDAEKMELGNITKFFKGNCTNNRHDQDAHHIFESIKYGGKPYFITEDGRIQKKLLEHLSELYRGMIF